MSDKNNNDEEDENKPKIKLWQKLFGIDKLSNFLVWIIIWAAIGAFVASFMGFTGMEHVGQQILGAIIGIDIFLAYRFIKNHYKKNDKE